MTKQPLMQHKDRNGEWLLGIWLSLFFVITEIVPDFFHGLPIRDSPLTEPPWYFIAEDFRQFLGAVICVFVSLLLIIPFYEKYPKYAMLALFFAFLFNGDGIGTGVSILLNTENLFEPEIATTTWGTHEEYRNSDWQRFGNNLYLLIILLGYLWLQKRQKTQGH